MDPISTGIAINAISELAFYPVKEGIKSQLKPTITQVYDRTITKTEKQFPGSKNTIKRIFKSITIKKRIKSLSQSTDGVKNYLLEFSRRSLKIKDADLEIEKVITFFMSEFIKALKADQTLWDKVQEAYLNRILEMSQTNKELSQKIADELPLMQRKLDGISKQLMEKSKIFMSQDNNLPIRIGAFKLHIFGITVQDIVTILGMSYNIISNENKLGMKVIEIEDEKNKYNVIRLPFEGDYFKIVYPPEEQTTIWLKPKNTFVELVFFDSNKNRKGELKSIITNYFRSARILEVTFDSKIVELFKKYIKEVSYLKYNPRIKHVVKIKNVTHTMVGDIGILGGQEGFLEDENLLSVISNLKVGNKKNHSDIYFFKSKKISGVYSESIDIDFHRDGRIIGLFPRDSTDMEQARKNLYDFIATNGLEK